jgi:hypothetical protein
MEGFNLDEFIVLLLLEKNDNFRDSYSLNRILSWQFGILPVIELKEKMMKSDLIYEDSSDGLLKYYSTIQGREYMRDNLENGKLILFEIFSNKQEFLNALFDGFVCPRS